MKQYRLINLVCLILALQLAFVSLSLKADEKDTLIVGKLVLSNNTGSNDVEARAEAIAADLSDLGVTKVEVVEVNSISQLIDMLEKGQIDWVSETLFPALICAEYADADIFEQRLKEGLPKFYSVFFVRKESDIDSVDKLDRKMLAFGNAFSSGSYFAPYYELNEQRYTLVNYGAKIDEELIGGKRRIYYRYSFNSDEVVRNVLTRKVDIGVLDYEDYAALSAEKKDQLKIIHNTAAFIKNVEVVRGNLKLSIKKKLKQLIYEHNAERDQLVPAVDNEKTTRFYKFVGEGRDGFVYLRSLVEHGTVPVLIEKKEKKKKKNYFY